MHQKHAFAVSPARAVATAGSDLPAGGTGRLVIAVFDELSSLSGALQPLHDQHTRLIHHQGGTQSDAASTIRASLKADRVDARRDAAHDVRIRALFTKARQRCGYPRILRRRN